MSPTHAAAVHLRAAGGRVDDVRSLIELAEQSVRQQYTQLEIARVALSSIAGLSGNPIDDGELEDCWERALRIVRTEAEEALRKMDAVGK